MSGPPPAIAAVRSAVRRLLTGADGPEAGDLVLVACSGGPDSVALLAATVFEGPRAGVRVGAVTVDHGWYAGSAERAAAVVCLATGLGADPAVAAAAPADRTEDAARVARYAALDAAAEQTGAALVLLGHTLDDQAETVLLGLARGSGARSLSGMPARRGRFARPLLGLPRSEVRAAAEAAGVELWDDPANLDPAYARARVRHDALPALEAALGPGVVPALARSAALLAADADALDAWASAADPGGDDIDVETLQALPTAVRTRVLRRLAVRAGAPAGALTAAHVAALDALVVDWHGQGAVHLPTGLLASRACGRLTVRRGTSRSPGA